MGKWKAVRYNLDSDIEVYNIENDKGETEDLAKMYPDVVKRAEIVFKHADSFLMLKLLISSIWWS